MTLPAPARPWRKPSFLRDDAPTIGVALLLFSTCYALMAYKGIYFGPGIVVLNAKMYLAGIGVMLCADISWRLLHDRPDRPLAYLKANFLDNGTARRWLSGLPILLMLMGFMPFFSKMKSMIPLFNEYDWDATFIAWDQALFLGHDAWRVLQPLVGYPLVTSFISACYQLWLLLIYPGCLFICFYRVDPEMRRRFFLTFILCWTVVGGALATAFASYGPCFVEPLTGNPHFREQMAYLAAVHEQYHVWALPVQQLLLDWFHHDARGLGSGITAMPSMHVAMAFLYYLAMRQVNIWAGRAFLLFFVIIFVGSVHLAYHYAVDGLVSIAATWLLWVGAKHFFRAWDVLLDSKAQQVGAAAA